MKKKSRKSKSGKKPRKKAANSFTYILTQLSDLRQPLDVVFRYPDQSKSKYTLWTEEAKSGLEQILRHTRNLLVKHIGKTAFTKNVKAGIKSLEKLNRRYFSQKFPNILDLPLPDELEYPDFCYEFDKFCDELELLLIDFARQFQEHKKRATAGISYKHAAEIQADGDPDIVRKLLKRWNKSHVPRPTSIGNPEYHAQVKLFAPTDLLAWVKKNEKYLICDEAMFLQRLVAKAVKPR